MDACADEHKSRNGCPAARTERSKPWETKDRQVSPNVEGSSISTKGAYGMLAPAEDYSALRASPLGNRPRMLDGLNL